MKIAKPHTPSLRVGPGKSALYELISALGIDSGRMTATLK